MKRMAMRLAGLVTLIACSESGHARVDLARLRDDNDSTQWIALGRTWRGDHYSPLARIDTANVARLGLAWEYDFRSRRGRVEFGQEATPIVVDGVLYVSGPWGTVVALDGATGRERWRYDPVVDGSYVRRACCAPVNRGVLVWRGRVFVATLDGYLVALDAETGKEIWRADTFIDRDTRFYTITGAPRVVKDKVVIGNAGAEFGVRGYVSAYDADTGELAWRFYIVPGDPRRPRRRPEMRRSRRRRGPECGYEMGGGGTAVGRDRLRSRARSALRRHGQRLALESI